MIEVFEKFNDQFKSYEGLMSEVNSIFDNPYHATLHINPQGVPYLAHKEEDGTESVKCLGADALQTFELIEKEDRLSGKFTILSFLGYELSIPSHVGAEILS